MDPFDCVSGRAAPRLAWVQSSQVAAALRAAHPGLEVELVGIDTRGDRVLDVPLSAIEGKEFFTAEIDAALLRRPRRPHGALAEGPEPRATAGRSCSPPCRGARTRATSRSSPPMCRSGWPQVPACASARRRRAAPQLLPPFFARALPHAARNRDRAREPARQCRQPPAPAARAARSRASSRRHRARARRAVAAVRRHEHRAPRSGAAARSCCAACRSWCCR